MFKSDAIKHFGKGNLLAKFLNITSGSVSQWGDVIPEKQALRLEKLTKGSLKYDPTLYKKVA
ncbi:Cro/CI family transcriptional regulator [Candidatus Williamhamiltonella defendens]|uniref:Uncharacterized protein n=1 Tax=Candidatus Hamiltonella defensa (Bemisia tabaci) TaxID=672795 RepID=A0A249DWF9_9ENTR|nr:Cro/CI family transcriptional regulator [Candidatus Hamiltonella defensa]ASX25886.1 hypothetical protein BA171_01715 [Candidatus Hamiltonella defensa (Bemisia tabaci)]CED78265.1 Regulatory protein cro [Candidatus Hamiltonella defensa (Bemisia tabaci)]